ncbi:MAG: LemA family protein [Bacteroidota bacterium]
MKSVSRYINIIPVLLLGFFLSSCGYNDIARKQERVAESWSQVENVYQRRADLVPNLVNTVKGAANFEQGTLTAVIEARASATAIKLSADSLTPERLANFQKAQDKLGSTLSRLMVVSENYPELKSTVLFQDLTTELAGTENRIAEERRKFNEATKDFNTTISTFPNNMTAGWFGFARKPYFTATAGSDKAPSVQF